MHKENKNKAIQIINKLKEYYNLKNDVDFAEYLGIPSTTLSSWKSRDSIDYDLVYSKCVGIDANWILTGAGNMLISTRENSQNSLLKMEDNIKNKYILQLENENRRLLVDNERKQELINLFINGDITTSKRKKLTKRMVI
ncbi:MAG: helix-turn-helix domain-containing protein [Paludibacter sp.]|nr:helix-turn-helix domain-containing protein [Paludibacter sp.]